MPGTVTDSYALLESSFQPSPNFISHNNLPRHLDDLDSILPASAPLKQDLPLSDDGLPPTPPSNSQDGAVTSLVSKKSSLSTPVNQRSPPTPDPSPPRSTESMTLPERPHLFAYPSSRADSFKTAREDQFSSEAGDSRTNTPFVEKLSNTHSTDRLSNVKEDYGLGLVFAREDDDATPTNGIRHGSPGVAIDNEPDDQDILGVEPSSEWNTYLMRNVTVRTKRNSGPSPKKESDAIDTASPTVRLASTLRRKSSLRERVAASKNSPITPSFENFAQSIGWPAETTKPQEEPRDVDYRRLSGSSMTSTVVAAMVIVTPPRQRRALRHSGKNLAYRADSDSPTDSTHTAYSNQNSVNSGHVPLHRLVHKTTSINSRKSRVSMGSDAMGTDRYANGVDRYASPLSIRKRGEDSAAATLAHQESVRRVLQPAADIMSRTTSAHRPYLSDRTYHKRIASAPEPIPRRDFTPEPRCFLEISPPQSPTDTLHSSTRLPVIELSSPSTTTSMEPLQALSSSPRLGMRKQESNGSRKAFSPNKSLPRQPAQPKYERLPQEEHPVLKGPRMNENQSKGTRREALIQHDERELALPASSDSRDPSTRREPSSETVPTVRQGSISIRGRSEERRRSSSSQDRTSTSRDKLLRPALDRVPTEELPRDGTRRVSFDSSSIRTEEHAMARHLYAQTTPFSQTSDTPIEVSEATAVSIYPHNNHSLLVVQQLSRSSTQPIEQQLSRSSTQPIEQPRQAMEEVHHMPSDLPPPEIPPTPPFVDAIEEQYDHPLGPTLTLEPSTPPMQLVLPVSGVDSPLTNPRPPPEPPIIQFIPPTPMEELERTLAPSPTSTLRPGPPQHSNSHPQRRLSLVQRARRYSGNIISPFLGRAGSGRGRFSSNTHENPRIPTVADEDGSLHPFWRPRGFWDGFEDADSDSDDALPQGGDTSDVEDFEPEPERRNMGSLSRRLTNGIKGSGGFLIGNSLGVERSGTNKRRPHILLPLRRVSSEPKIRTQPSAMPLSFRSRSPRIEKRSSRSSLGSQISHSGSSAAYERSRIGRGSGARRTSWKHGKTIPGLGMQVQYIGLSGVKERLRERKAEKRRETIRKSIGSRYYVEGGASRA